MSATFAEVLRRLRLRRALSQEALAQLAGMSASAISALERGERTRPYPHTVTALAEALGLVERERHELVDAATGSSAPPRDASSLGSHPLTSFVGRADLLALATDLLAVERLVTLTGLGGIGKTRLAAELVERTAELFSGGRWTVDVESSNDRTPVEQLVAVVLGQRDQAKDQQLDALTHAIGSRPCLLVLDGCERRTSECAAVASRLLASCPGLVVLVTSQRPLAVQGEVIVALPPLGVPGLDEACVRQTESVRLFVERARLASPAVGLPDEDLADVAELCRQLDGIPLAIELAAARTRLLPVAEVLVRMADRFALLRGEGDLPARKRAIRSNLEWSHELLSPDEGELFARLSVFAGGFTLDAVEAGPGRDLPQVLSLMAGLVDASLVAVDTMHGARGRFRLLDTVRAYASELLAQGPHAGHARQAHAEHYLDLAEACAPELQGLDQARVLRLLDEEDENLKAALAHWDASQERDGLVRLVSALSPYWVRRGRAREGQHWIDRVLSASALESIPLATLAAASDLYWITGDTAAQRRAAQRYLDRAAEAGDAIHRARATLFLSYCFRADPLLDEATWQTLLTEATALAEAAGDAWTLAMVLNDTAAGTLLDDVASGRTGSAHDCLPPLREAVRLARSTGDLNLVVVTLDSLAYAEARSDRADDALSHWSECLLELGEVVDPSTAAFCLEGAAQLAQLGSRSAACLTLLAASDAHRRRNAAPSPVLWTSVLADTERAARAALSSEASEAAHRKGAELLWAEAVDLALHP